MALVALFAPKRSEGANDATRNTKLYALQKSCGSHYYQYTKPNRRHLFHKDRLFNMKSCCGLQIPFTTRTLPFGRRKGAFLIERAVCHLVACSDNNTLLTKLQVKLAVC